MYHKKTVLVATFNCGPPRKLREGNVFSRVSVSVRPKVGFHVTLDGLVHTRLL